MRRLSQLNRHGEILADAFTEWDRRYREEPERFQNEAQLLKMTSYMYGQMCARYLMKIIKEQDRNAE